MNDRNLPLDEVALQQQLQDAYPAPRVPDSLQHRLLASAYREWGIAPDETPKRVGVFGLVTAKLGVLRGWPIAACVAALVCGLMLFRGEHSAYGWNAMVQAIRDQLDDAVIEMVRSDRASEPQSAVSNAKSLDLVEHDSSAVGPTRGQRRWAALSRGIVGETNDEDARVWDFRRGYVTQRRDQSLRRARLWGVQGNERQPQLAMDRVLLAMLLDRLDSVGSLADAKVSDRGWSRIEVNGETLIELKLSVEVAEDEQLLWLLLDPVTMLPQAFRDSEDEPYVTLRVSHEPLSAWTSASLPADLPVTEVALAEIDSPKRAQAAKTDLVETTAPAIVAASAGGTGPATEPTPVVGAASLGWKPVHSDEMTGNEFVESLDAQLGRLWTEQGIAPVSPASEDELLRRVYLDLVGRTPSVAEVRAYSLDETPDRYQRLVNQLLSSRDHATHIAASWRAFLLPDGVDLTRFGGVESFDRWMADRLIAGDGYDEIVRQLLLAEGRLTKSGPLLFYVAAKLDADKLAAKTARVFLGMRLECAQCHDDPFEPFTQEDFWGYAAFFAQISRPKAELESVSTVMRVADVNRGEVTLPDTEIAVAPRFLDLAPVDSGGRSESRRQQLARWMTSPQNPFFARATANRVWAHLFGRGIVNPVDGFGQVNQPQSSELLDLVAGYLVQSRFNLRELMRGIVLSRAYRLSSGASDTSSQRRDWFAQMSVKTLTAEQVYDCIAVATMLERSGSTDDVGLDRIGNSNRDAFIALFKTPLGQPTQYHGGIPQALTLMNGRLIDGATSLAGSGLLKSLDAPFLTDDGRIEVVYLATLARKPTESEWSTLREFVNDPETTKQEALADILWALLNSAEFTMNH